MAIDKAHAKAAGLQLPYKDVPTPELGEGAFVRVRCLSQLQKDEYEIGFWKADPETKKATYSAKGCRGRLLLLACEWMDTGELFFDSADEASAFRTDVGERLFDAAQTMSGMGVGLEELKKILGVAQTGASSTS